MKYPVIAGALLALAAATAPAFAEDAAPAAPAIVGNIALNSNYMFRGISQTNNAGAVSGGFDYQHGSGIYVGVWGSNVAFASSLETDFYAGYRGAFTLDWAYDVGYILYHYAKNNSKPDLDYSEIYFSTTWKGAKFGVNYSDDYFGGTNKYYYVYGAYSYSFTPEFIVSAQAGYNKFNGTKDLQTFLVTSNDPDDNYTDWRVGAAYVWGGLTFSANYIDSTLSQDDCGGADICDRTLVVGIAKSL